MIIALSLAAALSQAASPAAFDVRSELQGLYSEISQATLEFVTEQDMDQFHSVVYTNDWAYIDSSGQKHSWQDMRDNEFRSLTTSPLAWMSQDIQKVSLSPDEATVLVKMETVRAVADAAGRYGHPGASHTLTETTIFRDTWVDTPNGWKLKSRQQVRPPKTEVDKREQYT